MENSKTAGQRHCICNMAAITHAGSQTLFPTAQERTKFSIIPEPLKPSGHLTNNRDSPVINDSCKSAHNTSVTHATLKNGMLLFLEWEPILRPPAVCHRAKPSSGMGPALPGVPPRKQCLLRAPVLPRALRSKAPFLRGWTPCYSLQWGKAPRRRPRFA